MLDKAPGYRDCLIKEAVKRLHPRNCNRDGNLNLSQ
jgi:hypothetical protein